MFHVLYGLVCRKNFVVDEVCRMVKKVENYTALTTSLSVYTGTCIEHYHC
jgi:hypothetical protein